MDPPSSLSSPPQRNDCFLCSLKSTSKKKSKESSIHSDNLDWGIENDELFSDLSIFFVKEYEKILQKTMKKKE